MNAFKCRALKELTEQQTRFAPAARRTFPGPGEGGVITAAPVDDVVALPGLDPVGEVPASYSVVADARLHKE